MMGGNLRLFFTALFLTLLLFQFSGCSGKMKLRLPENAELIEIEISDDGESLLAILEFEDSYGLVENDEFFAGIQDLDNALIHENGRSYALIRNAGNQQELWFNRFNIQTADSISYLRLSPDGSNCAYVVSVDDQDSVYQNSNEIRTVDEVLGLRYTPDSSRLIAIYKDDGKYYTAADSEEGSEAVEDIEIVVSEAGDAFGYRYYARWREFVNINGNIFGGYTETDTPAFPDDGSRFGFVFIEGGSYYGKHFVSIDGEIKGPYDDAYGPWFSSDGFKVAFVYQEEDEYWIDLHNKTEGPFEWVELFAFSPDASTYGYVAVQNSNTNFYIESEKVQGLDAVPMDLRFSDDGSHYSLTLLDEDGYHYLIDGELYSGYDALSDIEFLSSDTAYWFGGEKDGESYLLSGGDQEMVGPADAISDPVFSEDGELLAYRMIEEQMEYAVIHGREYGPYSALDLAYSDEGIFYLAYEKKGKIFVKKIK